MFVQNTSLDHPKVLSLKRVIQGLTKRFKLFDVEKRFRNVKKLGKQFQIPLNWDITMFSAKV